MMNYDFGTKSSSITRCCKIRNLFSLVKMAFENRLEAMFCSFFRKEACNSQLKRIKCSKKNAFDFMRTDQMV